MQAEIGQIPKRPTASTRQLWNSAVRGTSIFQLAEASQ
jgi:hypothetical protein